MNGKEIKSERNDNMFSVSVVIPVYNGEETIIDALESVKKQIAVSSIVQIIVIDDGSTDNTNKIIQNYKMENSQLPIEIIRQDNRGVSSARNEGLKLAEGEWIAFLDSDDEWHDNRLSRQFEIIIQNPEIDFLGAGYNDKPLNILGRKITHLYKANVKDLTLKYFPCTPSILMRKKIFDEIGGFNEAWRYAEDGQYYTRICMKYNYYYLPEHLVDIGHGKRTFGEKGLSGNLKGMYEGNVHIIRDLRKDKVISIPYYCFLRMFYYAKYLRRIAISKLSNKRNNNE